MRGSVQGFGPGASPPMQLTQGHSALTLCEIGELGHHIGDGRAGMRTLCFCVSLFNLLYFLITLITA